MRAVSEDAKTTLFISEKAQGGLMVSLLPLMTLCSGMKRLTNDELTPTPSWMRMGDEFINKADRQLYIEFDLQALMGISEYS